MVQQGYRLVLGLACVLACWIAYKAWRNREATGARLLVGVALATAVWAGGSLGLTLATAPTAELRWLQFSYLGIVAAPVTFFILALEYTGQNQYRSPATSGSLLALGGGILGLVWTNPYHQLYWARIEYVADVPSGLATTPGVGFWGFVVFTYVLLLVGSLLFVRYAFTAPHLYRSQTTAILIAVGAPWAVNVPHALQFMSTDLTPVALSVTTVALWWAMFRYRLTDIGPIALRTVFESISTGVYVLDRHDRIVDVNAAGKDLLDLPDDVIGTPFREIAPNSDFYEHVHHKTDQPEIFALDASDQSEEDTPAGRYYEVQATPVESASGTREGQIVVVNDVTDQQRQQKQLERQNERLEEFTSVVSHDLRNPLNVAAGNLTLAQENGDGDHLERADQALSRMETLIDDLLALAYVGTQSTDLEPVDLEEVVADAWETVDTHGATLVTQADTILIADRSRLHQLIENLIRNAIEHGGEAVTVTIGDRANGFYVADDGPGIPVNERDEVFETGYSTREDGTGFGLNIVREVVDAHGWGIAVAESAEGGARFEITDVDLAEEASAA
jgi:PAS domain S-box-containing protein